MPSTPEQRKARYQEMHKDDFPIKALKAAITECGKATLSVRHSLKSPATHCLRGHLRTSENVHSNGTCIECARERDERRRKAPNSRKTHCKNGHPRTPENTNKTHGCVLCYKATRKRHDKKAAEAYAKASKARRLERDKVWINSSTGKPVSQSRKGDLQSYGWTQQMVEITSAEQGDRCAICRKPNDNVGHNGLVPDHKHSKPPEPRAMLCSNCNSLIGFAKDNPEVCRAAAEYLEAWA